MDAIYFDFAFHLQSDMWNYFNAVWIDIMAHDLIPNKKFYENKNL